MSDAHTIDKRDLSAADLDAHFAGVPREDTDGLTLDNSWDAADVVGVAVIVFLAGVALMLAVQVVRWIAVFV